MYNYIFRSLESEYRPFLVAMVTTIETVLDQNSRNDAFFNKFTLYSLSEYKFEIKAPKSTLKPTLSLIQLKLGRQEFLGVTSHENDNDAIEAK